MQRTMRADELGSLRAELTAAGVFSRHEVVSWVKLFAALAVAALSIGAQVAGPLWLLLLLMPVTALSITCAAMIGHDAGHRSFSKSPLRNELALHLTFPLLGGLGALYWKNKHNMKHHGHPNVVGVDEDLDLWPMAGSAAQYQASGRGLRWMQRSLQGWLFWPMTTFLTLSMRVASIRFLVQEARSRGISRALVADAACLTGHFVLWLVLPSLVFGFWPALGFFLGVWALVGVALSAIFAPAHLGLPLSDGQHGGWRLQLETTRNLRVPRLFRFLFVGLDHQVEHHLFSRIPHRQLVRAAPIVKRWAAERGHPYHEIGFVSGVADATRYVRRAWKCTPAVANPEHIA